ASVVPCAGGRDRQALPVSHVLVRAARRLGAGAHGLAWPSRAAGAVRPRLALQAAPARAAPVELVSRRRGHPPRRGASLSQASDSQSRRAPRCSRARLCLAGVAPGAGRAAPAVDGRNGPRARPYARGGVLSTGDGSLPLTRQARSLS